MPILKSAFKRMRQNKKRHLRNLKVKSELKALSKKLNLSLSTKKLDEAKALGAQLISKLEKARSKGIIHKNTASRKKSRILSKLCSTRII
ncbi:MAG: 30S ribosomal protein S20 [Candidatus Omnitrophota bacterium]